MENLNSVVLLGVDWSCTLKIRGFLEDEALWPIRAALMMFTSQTKYRTGHKRRLRQYHVLATCAPRYTHFRIA